MVQAYVPLLSIAWKFQDTASPTAVLSLGQVTKSIKLMSVHFILALSLSLEKH